MRRLSGRHERSSREDANGSLLRTNLHSKMFNDFKSIFPITCFFRSWTELKTWISQTWLLSTPSDTSLHFISLVHWPISEEDLGKESTIYWKRQRPGCRCSSDPILDVFGRRWSYKMQEQHML